MMTMLRAMAMVLVMATGAFAQPAPVTVIESALQTYPTHEQRGDMLRYAASELNRLGVPEGPFGALVKDSGNRCMASNGVEYSCDIICAGQGDAQRQWDVLLDEREPTWNRVGTIAVRPCDIVAAGDPQPDPEPDPSPDPEPTPDPNLAARVAALEAHIAALQSWADTTHAWTQTITAMTNAQQGEIRNLQERTEALEQTVARIGCRVILLGCGITGR